MALADHAYSKVRNRVVLPLAAIIVLSSIDRVNISFAAIGMNRDLGMDARGYGIGAGLFFVGYLLCQLPSTAVLRRIGARRWIALSVGGWGAVAAAMAFIAHPWQFYLARVLLGGFESGFAPGVVWYVSQWLPPDYRARTIGITLIAIPASVVIGAPLCGTLLGTGPAGLAGWRFMFLVEGLATLAIGIAALRWFVDRPADAAWLTEAQTRQIADAKTSPPASSQKRLTTTHDPVLWLSAAIWLALITGANGIIFWLPGAIAAMGIHDPIEIGILTALPWAAIGVGMYGNARHSDRTQERAWHLGLASALAAFGLAGAALVPAGGWALALLMAGGLGLGGAQGVFWAIPTQRFAGAGPFAITAINLCGNASSAVSPFVIGWAIVYGGGVTIPVLGLAVLLLAGAALTIPLAACVDRQQDC